MMTIEEKLQRALLALREIGALVVVDDDEAPDALEDAQAIAAEALADLDGSIVRQIGTRPVPRLVK